MRHSMLLFLAIIGIACAGGNRARSRTVAAARRRSASTIARDHNPEFHHQSTART